MKEREFQIAFERLLKTIIPGYDVNLKSTSDTIFHYINRAKDAYIKLLYRAFLLNQEISDKLRTLVNTILYAVSFPRSIQLNDTTLTNEGNNKWSCKYPVDYLFSLGEQVDIAIKNNNCPDLKIKTRDVIEATIETIDRILENSLSEYHLHHNQARPVRLYTSNKIMLYTDGNYNISQYILTYLRNGYDLGNSLNKEYEDLPEVCHQEIVDSAVRLYMSEAASTKSSDKTEE